LTLGAEMDGLEFTATPHKVNVYLNGDFVGLYTLCEQVQENEGRMNIELDEIDESMSDLKDYNFFIAMDESCIHDPGAKIDETYFYIEKYNKYFELKYPEKDQFTSDEQFASFMTQLKAYVTEMMDAFTAKDYEKILEEVNVNSLIDFMIIDQIMGERDHSFKSFNMYYTGTSDDPDENGKLNFGPIWDYDFCLFAPWTSKPNEYYTISNQIFYSNVFYKAMADIPEFYEIVKKRYNLYAKDALGNYIDNFDTIYLSMEESLKLNQERWYDGISADITDKNVKFLKDFLVARKELLDVYWAVE
jgi:hypothetical protein